MNRVFVLYLNILLNQGLFKNKKVKINVVFREQQEKVAGDKRNYLYMAKKERKCLDTIDQRNKKTISQLLLVEI